MSIRKLVLEMPLVRDLRRKSHLSFFLSPRGIHSLHGVYDSFEEARKGLPPSREFEAAPLVEHYVDVRCNRVFDYDYPVMLWLDKAMRGGDRKVLDIGGSVGVHYYAYQNYVSYPEDLDWVVAEISSVAAAGRALARRKDEHRIRFIETLDVNKPGADIWLSCGAIHYIEDARPDTLLQLARKKPVHFILNKLPLYAGEDYVCTQNIGDGCFAPLHVYSRDKLIADIESNGYALVDAWNVPGRSHYVPGHPDKSFDQYSGLYFRRK